MDEHRETIYQLLLAGGAVVLFIAGAFFIGTTYGTKGNLTTQGGVLLVGVIGLFIVLMLGAGLWLERTEF